MCSEMSQYMPSRATSSDTDASPSGRAAHAGSPWATRSAAAEARASKPVRPARCRATSNASAAIPPRPKVVATATWPMAAPPAGGEVSAVVAKLAIDANQPASAMGLCYTD
jgi:hypothetical protein